MIKKLIALLMALALSGGVALADVTWIEMQHELDDRGIKGKFHGFNEVAVEIWIPSTMKRVKLSQEDRSGGLIACYKNNDSGAQVKVYYTDALGVSLETRLQDALQNSDLQGVSLLAVNDLPALKYYNSAKETLNYEFITQSGYVMRFCMSPMHGENWPKIWEAVGASIQPEE